MKTLPHYTKVLTLGGSMTREALVGDVILQEKVDGSQFRFGINEDGEILAGSHTVNWVTPDACDKMFKNGVDHILMVLEKIRPILTPDIYFFCEFLNSPHHNTLSYGRTPKNHLVLFDVMDKGRWLDREYLARWADLLDIDLIPELYRGVADVDKIKELIQTPSYLGKEIVEGIVVKNYTQTVFIGGQLFPLFTKYVRSEFKERHSITWKSGTDHLEEFITSFCTPARWEKSIARMREEARLTDSVKDIGPLIGIISEDVETECKQDIMEGLYKLFIKDIKRRSTLRFPEYYKEKLLNSLRVGVKTE